MTVQCAATVATVECPWINVNDEGKNEIVYKILFGSGSVRASER